MVEIWKPVPIKEYFETHLVSNTGKIKGLDRIVNCKGNSKRLVKSRILKINEKEYAHIQFSHKGKTFLVHRLVAMAFIPNPKNLPQVNHLDGNKLNNNDWNLEWSDQSENQIHAYSAGLQKGFGVSGKDHFKARKIRMFNDNISLNFDTISAAAKHLNTRHTSIDRVLYGQRKKHLGYYFEYI